MLLVILFSALQFIRIHQCKKKSWFVKWVKRKNSIRVQKFKLNFETLFRTFFRFKFCFIVCRNGWFVFVMISAQLLHSCWQSQSWIVANGNGLRWWWCEIFYFHMNKSLFIGWKVWNYWNFFEVFELILKQIAKPTGKNSFFVSKSIKNFLNLSNFFHCFKYFSSKFWLILIYLKIWLILFHFKI